MNIRKEVPPGTLDLMVLKIIAREPMHGWGIMQRLRELTDDIFQVTPGALFPALQRIEENGWASSEWGVSESNRKAKYYSVTTNGRKQLKREEEHWQIITLAVSKVLQA